MNKIRDGIFVDFYKGQNFGDDLFVHILLKKFPNLQFNAYLDKTYKSFVSRYQNLHNYNNLYEKIKFFLLNKRKYGILNDIASRSKAAVLIGGSLFIEPNTPSLNNHLVDKSKPLFIMGSNFGPYKSRSYYEICKQYFNQATDVCFRDEYSFELFNLKNIRVAPDIVFSLPIRNTSDNGGCFISVINYQKTHKCSNKIQEDYEKFLLNIINEYLKKGEGITLAGFCPNEGDMEVVYRLLSKISQKYRKRVTLLEYRDNISEIIGALSNASAIVGTRFHSIVLGLSSGKHVLPISYSNKTENLLSDLGLSKYSLNIADLNHIEFKKSLFCNLNKKTIMNLRHKSNLQFKAFSEYVNRA